MDDIDEVDLMKSTEMSKRTSPFLAIHMEPRRTIGGSALQTYKPSPRNQLVVNKTQTNAEFLMSYSRASPQVKVPKDFELHLPNDRSFYQKSPVARFSKENGDFSTKKLRPSKLINRKLRM